jgi:serine O-acetyltransferase
MEDFLRDFARTCGPAPLWTLPVRLLMNPSLRACMWIRLGGRLPWAVGWMVRNRLLSAYGIDYDGCAAKVGPGLRLPHPTGIVLGRGSVVGRDVTIYHNVTLGRRRDAYPRIGDRVTIFPNAVIVGPVTIGAGAVIGANAFVDADVEAGAVHAGRG